MTASSFERGWHIVYIAGRWVYEDTNKPITGTRVCCRCLQKPTAEGHDACIGHVEDAISVCCGHGVESSYVIISGAPPCSAIQFSHAGLTLIG